MTSGTTAEATAGTKGTVVTSETVVEVGLAGVATATATANTWIGTQTRDTSGGTTRSGVTVDATIGTPVIVVVVATTIVGEGVCNIRR
jgi:hypothetical protein